MCCLDTMEQALSEYNSWLILLFVILLTLPEILHKQDFYAFLLDHMIKFL